MIARLQRMLLGSVLTAVMAYGSWTWAAEDGKRVEKPGPDAVLKQLKEGNARFVNEESTHPHTSKSRRELADRSNQGDYAYATVITCSDSRVPVEHIFDAGVMDLFVVRVAGNVCNTDEVGSIEYGLAHVHTPVLVVLGHRRCGAVTAVVNQELGQKAKLERNIPPMIAPIQPAAKRAIAAAGTEDHEALIDRAVVENVYQGIEDLFMKSPATRDLVKGGTVKVIGAVYRLDDGAVDWLPEAKVAEILNRVEANPKRAMEAMAASAKEKPARSKKAEVEAEAEAVAPATR